MPSPCGGLWQHHGLRGGQAEGRRPGGLLWHDISWSAFEASNTGPWDYHFTSIDYVQLYSFISCKEASQNICPPVCPSVHRQNLSFLKFLIFSCKGAALEVLMYVCPCVRPCVRPSLIWKYRASEGSWRFLKVPEDSWRFLKVPEGSWRFLKVQKRFIKQLIRLSQCLFFIALQSLLKLFEAGMGSLNYL